jgi:hypothetical protein
MFTCYLDDQFRSASFDFRRPKLWILFTGNTSMAYGKWERQIDNWLIKSTRHSLPSPQWPSANICSAGNEPRLGSRQSLVQNVEHNISGIQETLIMQWINACTDECCCLNADFCSSSPQGKAKEIHHFCSMIRRCIHSTSSDQAMVPPHSNKGSCDEDILD